MAIRGVLLDIDGTLVLSNDAHAHAWVAAYHDFGYDVPFERVRPLIGMGGDKLMATVTPDLSSGEGAGKQISERRKQIFLTRYAGSLEPAPGARDLLLYLRDHGVQMVAASSAKRDELDALLKAARVDDILRETTTASDVAQSKPSPDIVAVALRKLGLPAGQALMLGDTPYDIESASTCGLGTIAVRCGGTDPARLSGALARYDDPADLLAHIESSPLAPAIHV